MIVSRDGLETENHQPSNPYAKSTQSFVSRLEMLESNLTRVDNQHEALVPLLDLVELLPLIHKNL